MADPEIDIQVVIGRLTAQIAQMSAESAVKDALIEALRAEKIVHPEPSDD